MKQSVMLSISLLLMVAPSLALAKGPPHKDYKGKPDHAHQVSKGYDDDRIAIRLEDQRAINSYYGRHCPPGLAKKNPACMPPGQYKKYSRGDIIPYDVVFSPLPYDLRVHLHPTPFGTQYVMVDRNVYLISEATRKVLDAMVIASAIR